MDLKKGDLVENINQTKNRNIYIIVSIKENIYLGAKVIIAKDKATNLKWHYTLNDKDKILLIKYDNFSVLKTDSIKKSNYKINSNIYNLINKIYSLKEETKEERKIEHKKILKKKREEKKEKKKYTSSWKKLTPRESLSSMKSVHDPVYKGHIRIIRG